VIDFTAFFNQFLYDKNNPLLFSSGLFLYLFAAFISVYYAFRNNYKVRTWVFCCFSLYFFYKCSGAFVLLVIASAIVDFFIGNLIYEIPSKKSKKILLWVGLSFNIGLLIYFKYFNFILNTYNDFAGNHIKPLEVTTLIGISFYTFESISYMVDVYHRKILPAKRFADYLLFLSFFPKLVMGPIVRAADFLPQISKPYFVSDEDFSKGFYLIITGLFKKLIISDYISANFVNYVFDEPSRYSGLECLFATYGFAVVIYCDFSGYTNIAIGLAKWLGFSIPENFNLPYKSKDITEFWKRWHISLSNWLKDYIYIPLGGNRKGEIRKYINLIITMLIGGLWHGANSTYLIWGLMHGAALAIHKLWIEKSKYVLAGFRKTKVYDLLAGFITFQFVCIAWIFFRSENMTKAKTMFGQIKHQFSFNQFGTFWANYHSVVWMILLGLFFHFLPKKITNQLTNALKKEGVLGYLFIFFVFVLVYGYFKSAEPILPIYLQF
jgi:D-alanyl-lipoteichoic acid acyltransferase DltB (MBOAT superfamily)